MKFTKHKSSFLGAKFIKGLSLVLILSLGLNWILNLGLSWGVREVVFGGRSLDFGFWIWDLGS